MREVVVDRRVAIVDNVFDLFQFLNDELAAFEDVYLDVDVLFSRVYCGMRLAIVQQRVELQLHSLDDLFHDVWLVFILQKDFSAFFVELPKRRVKLIDAEWKLEVD